MKKKRRRKSKGHISLIGARRKNPRIKRDHFRKIQVQVKTGDSWKPVAMFSDKRFAIEYAHAYANAKKEPVRIVA